MCLNCVAALHNSGNEFTLSVTHIVFTRFPWQPAWCQARQELLALQPRGACPGALSTLGAHAHCSLSPGAHALVLSQPRGAYTGALSALGCMPWCSLSHRVYALVLSQPWGACPVALSAPGSIRWCSLSPGGAYPGAPSPTTYCSSSTPPDGDFHHTCHLRKCASLCVLEISECNPTRE